jgi:hypothetical protein
VHFLTVQHPVVLKDWCPVVISTTTLSRQKFVVEVLQSSSYHEGAVAAPLRSVVPVEYDISRVTSSSR